MGALAGIPSSGLAPEHQTGPALATGRREPDVADPGLKVGPAETVDNGRDHRADREQASVAGVMLLL